MTEHQLNALRLLKQRAAGDYLDALNAALVVMEAIAHLDALPGPRQSRILYVRAGAHGGRCPVADQLVAMSEKCV